MKKYKVEIPEGYEINREVTTQNVNEVKSITIILEPIKKSLPETFIEYTHGMSRYNINEQEKQIRNLGKLILLKNRYNEGQDMDEPCVIKKTLEGNDVAIYVNETGILQFNNYHLAEKFYNAFKNSLLIHAKPLL